MTSMRAGGPAAIALIALAACVAVRQPGAANSSPVGDATAVLAVAKAIRAAVLRDDPSAVCRRLTRRARRNSLIYSNYVSARYSHRHPGRATCRAAVAFLIDEYRLAPVDEKRSVADPTFRLVRHNPALASLTVVRVVGKRAHVRLVVPTNTRGDTDTEEIYFLRGHSGWRADYAPGFAPFDGSSGE